MLKFTKSSFVQSLTKGRLLVPYLERYDKWDHPFEFKYSPKQGDTAWHPSGDCLPSAAELYAYALDKSDPKPHSPGLQKAFLVGHFWHQVLQDVIVDLGFATPEDIERTGMIVWKWEGSDKEKGFAHSQHRNPVPYHWTRGAGDVAPLTLPSWKGILDIKTMRSDDFKLAAKTGLLPSHFAAKYEAQINMYMRFFDLDKGMILAVNKDSPHSFAEFIFERNDDLIEAILAKWEYVSHCIDKGVPPMPDADAEFVLPITGPIG